MSCFSLTNFKIFALSLTFNSLVMRLGVAIILFILIAVHWTLISKLIFFFKFRKKICPLFLQIFFLPLNSFLSFWDTHYTYTGMPEPTDLWDSACLPWFFFLHSPVWIISIDLYSCLLNLSSASSDLLFIHLQWLFHFSYFTIQWHIPI